MGLRIELKIDEAITISEPDGSSVIITRHSDHLSIVDWREGERRSRVMLIRLNSICPVGRTTTMRVRTSRRGEAYLSFTLYAPDNVVIFRTEEPRGSNGDTRSPRHG